MTTRDRTDGRAGILLVDDMEDNLVALEAVLASLDEPLIRARSGEEAMKALLRQRFAHRAGQVHQRKGQPDMDQDDECQRDKLVAASGFGLIHWRNERGRPPWVSSYTVRQIYLISR